VRDAELGFGFGIGRMPQVVMCEREVLRVSRSS
jgi:hypothetical protein